MKLTLKLFFIGAVAATSLQCTRSTEASRDLESLYIGLGAPPQTLDPRSATDATGMRLNHLLFSSLVRLGPNLEIVGEAAERWEYLTDKNTYRFYLRDGLTFSNGRAVDSKDVLFSIREYRKPGSPFHAASQIITDAQIHSIENQKVLDIQVSEFSATFLTDLTPMKILPEEELSKGSVDFRTTLIGSGPYELNRWSDQELVFKRRETPYGTPKMENLIFKVVRDDTTRVQRLLRGELDVVQADLPFDKIDTFRARQSDFTVFEFPGLSMTYMLLNLKDPALAQPNIRKALAHALNPEEIITYKFNSLAQAATSLLTPLNPFFHSGLSQYTHNLPLAKKLLEQASFSEESVLTIKTSNAPSVVDHARIISTQLEQAGIKTRLQSFEWATFYSDISSGNFQIALMKWVGATDPDIYRVAFHSKELPPGRNRGSYINENLDRLLDEGIRLADTSLRKMHYQRIQEIVQEELPIIPLWYEKQVAVANSRVEGYEPSPNGDYTAFMWTTKTKD